MLNIDASYQPNVKKINSWADYLQYVKWTKIPPTEYWDLLSQRHCAHVVVKRLQWSYIFGLEALFTGVSRAQTSDVPRLPQLLACYWLLHWSNRVPIIFSLCALGKTVLLKCYIECLCCFPPLIVAACELHTSAAFYVFLQREYWNKYPQVQSQFLKQLLFRKHVIKYYF